ncbi:MAG: hypothetical protein A2020_00790 [Lentisphaerae bacterium GWF2_45_14]|nr:MAG: hypothetical protein A2020_00790 [Lentisphaerae bacterium GWF2_45_14]
MKKHYAQYFREVIEGQKRTIEVLSSAVKEAEKSAGAMREKRTQRTRKQGFFTGRSGQTNSY